MSRPARSRPSPSPAKARRLGAVLLVAAGAITIAAGPVQAAVGSATTSAPAAGLCTAMDDAVNQRTNPTTNDTLLTTSRATADAAQTRQGYSDDDGVAFLASATWSRGMNRVHHLINRATGQSAYTGTDGLRALLAGGYTLRPDGFFASSAPVDCLDPVYELVRASDGQHQLAVTVGQRDQLTDDGYTFTRVAFYAATDTTFAIAVIPDTQQEVHPDRAVDMFADRASWLAANEDALDLRYITHTGDVVDWDTPGHEQYEVLARGVAVLDSTGIPYSFAIGNHDTMATDVGGSARPGQDTRANQLITTTFNSYVGVEHVKNLRGTFEANKVDNSYSTFAAGGKDWLVLHLELWPRAEAVEWAKQVVAAHPRHNVIVVTHSFLEADGTIKQTNGGYGHTSPQYVFDQLIAAYPNVRFVFSGHTGVWAQSDRTGAAGNPIHLIQGTYHDWTSNPTRILELDTATDSFSTYVYAPYTHAVKQDGSTFSRTGLQLVG